MKKIIFFTLLIIPQILFAQRDSCFITMIIEKSNIPISHIIVDVIEGSDLTQRLIANVTDTIHFVGLPVVVDSLQLVAIRITYYDTSGKWDSPNGNIYIDTTRDFYKKVREIDFIPLFVSQGVIELIINNPEDKNLELSIRGPLPTMQYNEELYEPVRQHNELIEQCDKQLKLLRLKGADTVGLIKEKTLLIKSGFNVSRTFIKTHPNSILSIQALKMMGTGDPTVSKPLDELKELFNSLSAEIRNSNTGKNYATTLKQMMKS